MQRLKNNSRRTNLYLEYYIKQQRKGGKMKVKVGTHNFLENPKRYGGLIFLLPTIEFGFGGFFSITVYWICFQIAFYLTKEEE